MANERKEIQVEMRKYIARALYANSLNIMHTADEFILDFYMIAPPTGTANARVITSPGHVKRILKVIEENIAKYEDKYGKIKPSKSPDKGTNIGFRP